MPQDTVSTRTVKANELPVNHTRGGRNQDEATTQELFHNIGADIRRPPRSDPGAQEAV